MPTSLNTKDPAAVARATKDIFLELFPGANPALVTQLFTDITAMFAGRYMDYQAIDVRYHDLEHTLQATWCFVRILRGRHHAGAKPVLTPRDFELGLAAVLMHDTGYLKLRADTGGTGAKYTYAHVLRSCSFAASYLPTIGITEIDIICGAIRCTGPESKVDNLNFRGGIQRILGCAVATGDYLGQMAAPDYVDELPILFAEFQESDDFLKIPVEKRFFKNPRQLLEKTPLFWEKFVLAKLTDEFESLHRFLDRPDGTNPYLEAIARNLDLARQRARDNVG